MVQLRHLSPIVFVYSLPLGFFAAAIIHANNMRDIEDDTHAGKRTIASLVDMAKGRAWFIALLIAAYLTIIALSVPHNAPHLMLITLWTLPGLVVVISGAVRTHMSTGFHLVMHQTLRLETFFTFLWVIALLVSIILHLLSSMLIHLLPI